MHAIFNHKGNVMPRFFNHRSNLQVVGDVAVSGLHGLRNGALGKLLLAASGTTIAAPITAVATACAVGGMLTIIPAMYIYQQFFKAPDNAPFMVKVGTDLMFKTALAAGSACLGAAVMGMAMSPIVLAGLSTTLTLGLLGLMTSLIVDCTSPDTQDKFLAARITQ
jgi:hypothetical protein